MSKKFVTEVVGMQHRLAMSTRRMMQAYVKKEGVMEVYLAREPENKFDPNAIKVVVRESSYRGIHIGYVPRGVAEIYAPALDQQKARVIDSYLTAVQPDDGTATLTLEVKRLTANNRKSPVVRPKKKSRKKT